MLNFFLYYPDTLLGHISVVAIFVRKEKMNIYPCFLRLFIHFLRQYWLLEMNQLESWVYLQIGDLEFQVAFATFSTTTSITSLRRPALSLPKQIPIQLLLYKTTICLTQPATTFLSPKWKKTCLKQSLQTFTQQITGNKHKATMLKNESLSDYIYSIATL